MIRLPGISVPLGEEGIECARAEAARILRVPVEALLSCRLARQSVDARRKDDVHYVVTLDVALKGDEAAILRGCGYPNASLVSGAPAALRVQKATGRPRFRPVVVGSGPAGLFAALTLAMAGVPPLLLERGRDVRARRRDVEAFWQGGLLDETSNVHFGEGGAGTFSDGKLNTGIKNPHCAAVLEIFRECGAPDAICWQSKPHIGTDHLARVVQGLRERILSLGGEVRFEAPLTGLIVEQNELRGCRVLSDAIGVEHMILSIGHSAADTFEMLHAAGVSMMQKPFSMGVRIEHPQSMIDRAQYGRFAELLGAAEYKLSAHLPNGRGVYTFCMCPGGVVVAVASEAHGVVTNGMSAYARDGQNANSALLVDVRPADFGADDPLAGFRLQRLWERKAFHLAGEGYRAPAQRAEDFIKGRASTALGDVVPSYRPGVVPSDLRQCLPSFVAESIAQGLLRFDRQIPGFAMADAVLTGVETRSSCPVRIPRDETGQASVRGLFPAGEGAGYAGGILSAAVDGIRAAERLISSL